MEVEVKKSPKADLEDKKTLFFEIGLIVTLLISLAAFEWKTYERSIDLSDMYSAAAVMEEETIPVTREDLPPPPPPDAGMPVFSDDIIIVDDDIKIDTDLIITTEDDSRIGVAIVDYVSTTTTTGRRVEEAVVEEEIPFTIVEEKPKFQGGDENTFTAWIQTRLKYPDIAIENGISGRVMLTFVVDTDGSVKDVALLRGVDPSLDQEAIRIVSSSPRWTPGRQQDKPVKVRFQFPIFFELK